jgi:HD-GYP domain-containing protein (c-di-GMP phosphodiesterase class II)
VNTGAPDLEMVKAREFLRSLSAARQVFALYPSDHPKRTECAQELRERIAELTDATGRATALFVSDGNFYMGPTLLAWESLTLNRLARSMSESGVRSLEFQSNASIADADALMRVLIGEQSAESELHGIALNRATPVLPEAAGSGMAELLQSYAAGLELLRQTAARLLAGRPADLHATVELTEHLAELIAEDPAQTLLLTAVKSYDEYTYHHMVNVCILSLALARAIGLSHEQSIALGIGGLLHDVGKVKVPQEVLQHDGLLDEEQWGLIHRHPVDGAGIVAVTTHDPLHSAVSIVLEHHVGFDGSGYPTLSGARPPALASRIVAVADCFDALTSKRSYRKPEERRQALAIIQAGAGRSFDPRVVRTFVRMVGLFPVGSLVQLATGEVGVVVRNHDRDLGRPSVRMVLDAKGSTTDPVEIDLAERTQKGEYRWAVVRTIDPVDVGIDMLSLLASGRLDVPPPVDAGPGLIHEPAPGEVPPPGYVEPSRGDARAERTGPLRSP